MIKKIGWEILLLVVFFSASVILAYGMASTFNYFLTITDPHLRVCLQLFNMLLWSGLWGLYFFTVCSVRTLYAFIMVFNFIFFVFLFVQYVK